MKKNFLLILIFVAVSIPSLHAQVKETPATLGLAAGGNPQGYVQNSNDNGILFATTSGGAGQLVTYEKIRGEGLDKLIRFEERVEALAEGRALYAAEQYTEAAAAFGKVAREYAIIINVPKNFATEALFYQAESLRRSGRYSLLAQVVNAPVAKTIETKLDQSYQKDFEFMKLWALLGEEDYDALKSAIAAYEEPVTGDAKLLATPNFVKLPSAQLAQLGFLRAKVFDKAGDKTRALDDYYRSFTLAYGNDPLLSKLAMGQSMLIKSADPKLETPGSAASAEMQSLAYMFSIRFGKDSMPEQFQKYAVRPAMAIPNAAPAAEAEADPPAEAPAEKAE
ncbi:MAG: hypothetical protein P1U58_09300 [Verrucomicrobiales bacterium]|nr:hypothetical protein [Verrucomicrobiales bacterium]